MDEHRYPFERLQRHTAAVDGRPGESQRFADTLEPAGGSAGLFRRAGVGKILDDRLVPGEGVFLVAAELVGDPHLEERFGGVRRRRMVLDEPGQFLEPGSLHLPHIGAGSLHRRGVTGRRETESGKGLERLVIGAGRHEGLELLGTTGKGALLDQRGDGLGELACPERRLIGLRRRHHLLEDLDLLGGGRSAGLPGGAAERPLDLAELREERLEGLVLGRHLAIGRSRRHPRREKPERLRDLPLRAGNLRDVDRPPDVPAPQERPDINLPRRALGAGIDERDDVVVGEDILRHTGRAGRKEARQGGKHVVPLGFGADLLLGLGQANKILAGFLGPPEELGEERFGESGRDEIVLRRQEAGEDRRITGLQCCHDLRGRLFGRKALPGIERAVFIFVHPPAGATHIHPPRLVGLGVEIGVNVAVDLDAIFEVAPAVDDLVAVGVGETAEHLPARPAHHPRIEPPLLLHLEGRSLRLIGGELVVIDILLERCEPQGVLDRRLCRRREGRGNQRRHGDERRHCGAEAGQGGVGELHGDHGMDSSMGGCDEERSGNRPRRHPHFPPPNVDSPDPPSPAPQDRKEDKIGRLCRRSGALVRSPASPSPSPSPRIGVEGCNPAATADTLHVGCDDVFRASWSPRARVAQLVRALP